MTMSYREAINNKEFKEWDRKNREDRDWDSEWRLAYKIAKKDLLPTIGNPCYPKLTNSALTTPFKTPSQLIENKAGELFYSGIANRNAYICTKPMIRGWMKNPAYGIMFKGVQHLAIDIDVENEKINALIHKHLCEFFKTTELAYRYRNNSFRRLYIVKKDFEVSKVIIRLTENISDGIIEILGDKQVYQIFGTHKSGVNFKTTIGDTPEKRNIPEIREKDFEKLITLLNRDWYKELDPVAQIRAEREGLQPDESRTGRNSPLRRDAITGGEYIKDEYYERLKKSTICLGTLKDDALYVLCPNHQQHTTETGSTDTVYYPARKGDKGIIPAKVHCLHSSCDRATVADLLISARPPETSERIKQIIEEKKLERKKEKKRVELPTVIEEEDKTIITHRIKVTKYDREGSIKLNRSKKIKPGITKKELIAMAQENGLFNKRTGRIMENLQAVKVALSAIGVVFRYDRYSLKLEVWIPGMYSDWQVVTDGIKSKLVHMLEDKYGFSALNPKTLDNIIKNQIGYNEYDSLTDYILAEPWDGIPRIDKFVKNVFALESNSVSIEQATNYFKYFFTAAAGRMLNEDVVKADMVLVLCSRAKGIGKTTFCQLLAPVINGESQCAHVTQTKITTNLKQIIYTKAIVCLDEMVPIKDEKLLAEWREYITSTEGTWRAPYEVYPKTIRKRSMVVGTTNSPKLLTDANGNRRYLILNIKKINTLYVETHIRQLYAEGLERYLAHGVEYQAVEKDLALINLKYTKKPAIQDKLYSNIIERIKDDEDIGIYAIPSNSDGDDALINNSKKHYVLKPGLSMRDIIRTCEINRWYKVNPDEEVRRIYGLRINNTESENEVFVSLNNYSWVYKDEYDYFFSSQEALDYYESLLA